MGRYTRLDTFQIEVIDFHKRNNGGYAPRRTLIKKNTTLERARRWGERFGTILSCRKVGWSDDRSISLSSYLDSIELIELNQEPIEIEIDRNEFVLNKALELSRPRRRFDDKKYDPETLDNEE